MANAPLSHRGLALEINELDNNIKGVGSLAAALSSLKPMAYDPTQPTSIMAGVGTYRGSKAVALGLSHYQNDNLAYHVGLAYGNKGEGKVMANASVTWKFGPSQKEKDSEQFIEKDVEALYKKINEMEDVIATLEAKLKEATVKK